MGYGRFLSIAALATLGCSGSIKEVPVGDAGTSSDAGAAIPGPPGAGGFGGVTGGGVNGPSGGGLGGGSAVGTGGPGLIAPGGLGVPGTSDGGAGPPPKSQASLVTLASGQTCPWGMAIDATSVYWTDCGDPTGGYVLKVAKEGGTVVTLATGDRLSGIAVANGSVYWVAGTSDASSGAIMQVPVGGGSPTTLATRPGAPAHIAADSSNVYWTEINAGAVMRVAVSGGTPSTVASTSFPWGLALAGTEVFWMSQGVMSAPKTGGTATALTASGPTLPTAGLAINATTVYFTSGPPGGKSGLQSVPVQGGPVTLVSATQSAAPGPVAIDGTRAYWADSSNAVYFAPLAGGPATTIAIGQNNVDAIAVDSANVYWVVNSSSGAVMRMPLSAL